MRQRLGMLPNAVGTGPENCAARRGKLGDIKGGQPQRRPSAPSPRPAESRHLSIEASWASQQQFYSHGYARPSAPVVSPCSQSILGSVPSAARRTHCVDKLKACTACPSLAGPSPRPSPCPLSAAGQSPPPVSSLCSTVPSPFFSHCNSLSPSPHPVEAEVQLLQLGQAVDDPLREGAALVAAIQVQLSQVTQQAPLLGGRAVKVLVSDVNGGHVAFA